MKTTTLFLMAEALTAFAASLSAKSKSLMIASDEVAHGKAFTASSFGAQQSPQIVTETYAVTWKPQPGTEAEFWASCENAVKASAGPKATVTVNAAKRVVTVIGDAAAQRDVAAFVRNTHQAVFACDVIVAIGDSSEALPSLPSASAIPSDAVAKHLTSEHRTVVSKTKLMANQGWVTECKADAISMSFSPWPIRDHAGAWRGITLSSTIKSAGGGNRSEITTTMRCKIGETFVYSIPAAGGRRYTCYVTVSDPEKKD